MTFLNHKNFYVYVEQLNDLLVYMRIRKRKSVSNTFTKNVVESV